MDNMENIYDYYEKKYKNQMPSILVPIIFVPYELVANLLENYMLKPYKAETKENDNILSYFDINFPENDED